MLHHTFLLGLPSEHVIHVIRERLWGDTLRLGWIDETQLPMDIVGKSEEAQHMNGGQAVKETVAQTAESIDEQIAASHRRGWENSWGSKFGRCGAFEDMSE